MSLATFTIYSSIGTLLWTLALTGAGFLLGDNYAKIEDYLKPISKLVVFGLLGLIGYWAFKKFSQRKKT
jgi:membrane protein DedA with SNARE-associated domain